GPADRQEIIIAAASTIEILNIAIGDIRGFAGFPEGLGPRPTPACWFSWPRCVSRARPPRARAAPPPNTARDRRANARHRALSLWSAATLAGGEDRPRVRRELLRVPACRRPARSR